MALQTWKEEVEGTEEEVKGGSVGLKKVKSKKKKKTVTPTQ